MKRLGILLFGVASYGIFFGTFLYLIGFLANAFVPRSVDGGTGPSTTVDVVFPPVVADFSCDPSVGFAPLTITCTDSSEYATSRSWDFGDGATSTETNPTERAPAAGPEEASRNPAVRIGSRP